MSVRSPDPLSQPALTYRVPRETSARENRIASVGLAFVLLLLAVRFVVMVRPRVMEFDQICTLLTANAQSWHAYIAAVPADSQPPFSHLAARLGMLLPLPEAIGVHTVSALMVAVTAVCLFRFFQKRGSPLAGLCSAALFTSSRCIEYMFTVRPYAALMAVTALGVVCYDRYRQERAAGRSTHLWPLAMTVVLAATIHALSLVYIWLPLLAGEAEYWWRTSRIDRKLWAAVVLASTAFAFDFTLARQIQTRYMSLVPVSARAPGLPTLTKLGEVLTIPIERRWQALLLGAIVAWLAVNWWKRRETARADLPLVANAAFPWIAAASLYLAGGCSFAIGVANHYFFTRYASPVYLCGPLLLGAALSTFQLRRLAGAPVAIASLLLLISLLALRSFLLGGAAHRSPREDYAAMFAQGDFVASPLAFPTLWWYATPQEREHMHIVTDPVRYRALPDGIPEVVLQRFAAAGVLPFRLESYSTFDPGREVLLVKPTSSRDTWLPDALAARGFQCAAQPGFHSEDYAMLRCMRSEAK